MNDASQVWQRTVRRKTQALIRRENRYPTTGEATRFYEEANREYERIQKQQKKHAADAYRKARDGS